VHWAGFTVHEFAVSKSNDIKSSKMCETSGINAEWRLLDWQEVTAHNFPGDRWVHNATHYHVDDNTLLQCISLGIQITAPKGKFIIPTVLPLRKPELREGRWLHKAIRSRLERARSLDINLRAPICIGIISKVLLGNNTQHYQCLSVSSWPGHSEHTSWFHTRIPLDTTLHLPFNTCFIFFNYSSCYKALGEV
jgi:hypothetical protein